MANENSNDGLWMMFFIVFLTVGIAYIIWITFQPQLLQGYLWARQGQVTVASLWTDNDMVVETASGPLTFGEAKDIIFNVTPAQLMDDGVNHWAIIQSTSHVILKPFQIPAGLLFAFLIYLALFKSPTSKHRRTYGLDDLIKKQAQTFPVISPIINFNPLKEVPHRAPGDLVPAELPLFAEALSPEEWIAFHKIPIPDGQVDEHAVEKALSLQLGDQWKGYQKLKPYQQVLLAAFALKAARKRKESDDMLGELALCWTKSGGLKLDRGLFAKARKILKNKDIAGDVINECNRHAYVTTALLGGLEKARSEGGVLAPAQFLWLRGHDRALWYPLNNLGRQAFHAEALGAMCHYRAEKQVSRPIPKPMMNDAITILKAYLEDKDKSMPIPQLDFSMIKNKKDPDKNKGIMKPAGT
jgi:intracellular multiplication protein IcmP